LIDVAIACLRPSARRRSRRGDAWLRIGLHPHEFLPEPPIQCSSRAEALDRGTPRRVGEDVEHPEQLGRLVKHTPKGGPDARGGAAMDARPGREQDDLWSRKYQSLRRNSGQGYFAAKITMTEHGLQLAGCLSDRSSDTAHLSDA
jgi:hypothetical protein